MCGLQLGVESARIAYILLRAHLSLGLFALQSKIYMWRTASDTGGLSKDHSILRPKRQNF
jgi:hypothetical protein